MARQRGIVKIEGVEAALTALGGPRLYERAMTESLAKLSEIGRREAERRAPVATGTTKAALASATTAIKVFPKREGRPIMSSVAVRGEAGKSEGGFRYAFALNASKKRVYRYRSGPFKGRKTLGWWKAAVTVERRAVRGVVADTAKEIERNFAIAASQPA